MTAVLAEVLARRPDSAETIAWYEERYRRIGQFAAMREAAQMLEDRERDWQDKLAPEFYDGVPFARLVLNAAVSHDQTRGWSRFMAPDGYFHRVTTPGPEFVTRVWPSQQTLHDDIMANKMGVDRTETINIGETDTDIFWAHELRVYSDCQIYACNLEQGIFQIVDQGSEIGLVSRGALRIALPYVDGARMFAARYPEEA